MATEHPQLNIFFFPFMAHGHMIPALDLAKLFASRGARSTIITTPLNVPFVARSVERSRKLGLEVDIKTLKFSASEFGLPESCENLDFIISNCKPASEMSHRLIHATAQLKGQLEDLIEEVRPDCLVSDVFFPWTSGSAAKFDVPGLVFHGTSFFALSAAQSIRLYEPHKKVSSDDEAFLIPNFPGDITITRNQTGESSKRDENHDMSRFRREARESELESFGVVMNSFYELEPAYADYYRKNLGRRAWHVGPVSLCNKGTEEKSGRGKEPSVDEHACLNWLDSKKPRSVVYLSFGSLTNFTDTQLMEIAKGLEASGKDFVWVVRRDRPENPEKKEEWLPDGFENRTKDKGLIIRGWAPQVLILEHQAIGAFVTHCGWNSTLESITAGVPMVTWPVAAEQFYNERFVTQVLEIGVSVGVKEYVSVTGEFVAASKVERAVKEIMEGEGAEERRKRARRLAELAEAAVAKGGSSDSDLSDLITELRQRHGRKMKIDAENV